MSDKNRFYVKVDGNDMKWLHRTPLKVVVNPILRKLQFFTNRPFVIVSKTSFKDGIPDFGGYVFKRVLYIKN